MIENKSILWADAEHMSTWTSTFVFLNKNGFNIEPLESTDTEIVLQKCEGKLCLVLHCGTANPISNMEELLLKVKQTYPDIVIGLQTAVKHPAMEELVHFYIDKSYLPPDLAELLNSVLK